MQATVFHMASSNASGNSMPWRTHTMFARWKVRLCILVGDRERARLNSRAPAIKGPRARGKLKDYKRQLNLKHGIYIRRNLKQMSAIKS